MSNVVVFENLTLDGVVQGRNPDADPVLNGAGCPSKEAESCTPARGDTDDKEC
jgi:hypothetical protein